MATTTAESADVEDGIRRRFADHPSGEFESHLDAHGWAVCPGLLTAAQCHDVAALYPDDRVFRSRIVMARHGFGRGEYQYFADPLPGVVAALRESAYPHLAPMANRWAEPLGFDEPVPGDARASSWPGATPPARPARRRCCCNTGRVTSTRSTRMSTDHVFPLQLAVLLSRPGEDFTGGEFVLTEQRPRMQSRAHVVPLQQGDGVVFAVRHRPAQGTRGTYRVTMRHGVSEVRTGRRHTLGVIFHDAT